MQGSRLAPRDSMTLPRQDAGSIVGRDEDPEMIAERAVAWMSATI